MWASLIKDCVDRFYSLTSIILVNSNIFFGIVFGYIWICATDIYVYGYRLTHSENVKLGKHHCQINKNVHEIYKINVAVTYKRNIVFLHHPVYTVSILAASAVPMLRRLGTVGPPPDDNRNKIITSAAVHCKFMEE